MAEPHNQDLRTSIRLSPMLMRQLDRLCAHYGENQSQTVRRLIIDTYAVLRAKYSWDSGLNDAA